MSKQTCSQQFASLQELILAMALGMIVAGTALEVGLACWRRSRHTALLTHAVQETILLKTRWRSFVHRTSGTALLEDPHTLHIGTHRARIVGNCLTFEEPTRTKRIPLPPAASATFALEELPEGGKAIVLTLRISRKGSGRKRPHDVRLVGCIPPTGLVDLAPLTSETHWRAAACRAVAPERRLVLRRGRTHAGPSRTTALQKDRPVLTNKSTSWTAGKAGRNAS